MRTAVVLVLATPMAISSAMMPEITASSVSPGRNHIQPDRADRRHRLQLLQPGTPASTAAIIPSSSETGMNAPDRPPTEDEAITPPFLTASLSSASAAVVPSRRGCRRPSIR